MSILMRSARTVAGPRRPPVQPSCRKPTSANRLLRQSKSASSPVIGSVSSPSIRLIQVLMFAFRSHSYCKPCRSVRSVCHVSASPSPSGLAVAMAVTVNGASLRHPLLAEDRGNE